jgi:ribosomal protein S18 acetylase RimI-like enzyme
MMAAMELRHARMNDPLVAPVLAGLEAEYFQRYGENVEMSRAEAGEFDPPAGAFVVLLDGDITAAGGGYRQHADGVCEVKRMWTHPDYRRQGLAERVLDALEGSATAAGYARLILETGPRQPEATALYERRGYARIPYYGHYPEALAFATVLTSGSGDESVSEPSSI